MFVITVPGCSFCHLVAWIVVVWVVGNNVMSVCIVFAPILIYAAHRIELVFMNGVTFMSLMEEVII